MEKYNPAEIEKKWQQYWQANKTNSTGSQSDNSDSANATPKRGKFYILDMFPYPSGEGLHVGHPKGYIATDIYSRFKKMQGYDVLHPMGWDAFGLPAEQYAIKNKVNPNISTAKNVARYKEQLQMIGLNYDWDREINTTDPGFYKWTQWMWKQMYKQGLTYQSFDPINWCPSCKTGLANEDLDGNVCERCGSVVEKKPLRQWTIRITDYADRLLSDLDKLDWEPHIKKLQQDWIGRSEGSEIDFKIKATPSALWAPSQREGNESKLAILKYNHELVEVAKQNRKNMTGSEVEFWNLVKNDSTGFDFTREKVIGDFIIDFYCNEIKLAIEIDGEYHNHNGFIERDEDRTRYLESLGIKVIRYKNEEVPNLKTEDLKAIFNSRKSETNASLGEAPRSGEGVVFESKFKIFTTRADTLFGATYAVLAPEHDLISELLSENIITNKSEIEKYIEEVKNKTDIERSAEGREKTGVKLEGVAAVNPANQNEIPIYIADYVLASYGTGAIMAVPAHDERDYEFAKKYNINIEQVIKYDSFYAGAVPEERSEDIMNYVVEKIMSSDGILINSGEFDGMTSEEARKKITEYVGGRLVTKYKLREWVFARQRYWGEPFPIVFATDENGKVIDSEHYVVSDSELPVKLPDVENYEPTGTGESPLAAIEEFVNVYGYINDVGEFVSCGKGEAGAKLFKRETNTMPQWAGSSWYYLRFIDNKNSEYFVSKDLESKWSPVDFYVGGAEHATRHLIYARFWHKFLFDMGLVSSDEPFKKLQTVGLIMAEDGRKMSKRWGNVVNPDDVINEYGADTLRIYEMFMGPFDGSVAWSTSSIRGVRRFLDRVWNLQSKINESADNEVVVNRLVKKVVDEVLDFKFNTAVAAMMSFLNEVEAKGIKSEDYKKFVKVLAPFAPHMCEELWQSYFNEGNSITSTSIPVVDESKLVDLVVTIAVQVAGKLRGTIEAPKDSDESTALEMAKSTEWGQKYIVGDIKKIIFVKNKILNIVI